MLSFVLCMSPAVLKGWGGTVGVWSLQSPNACAYKHTPMCTRTHSEFPLCWIKKKRSVPSEVCLSKWNCWLRYKPLKVLKGPQAERECEHVCSQTPSARCVRQNSLFPASLSAWLLLLLLSWTQFVVELAVLPQPFYPHINNVFVWIILTFFFPQNSKQSHFSPRPPTGEKQTFKASQTMSHTYTHSSMKRDTPAKEHHEAPNGHNGSLIIIHKVTLVPVPVSARA